MSVWQNSNVLLLSIPKSGRTWLRVMLDKCEHTRNKYNRSHDYKLIKNFDKIIYLHRDPIDVAVSSYYHIQNKPHELHDIPGADSNSINLNLYEFVNTALIPIMDYHDKCLQLIENKNKLIITYEELIDHGPKILKKVIEFISNIEIDENQTKIIYQKCDINSMKQMGKDDSLKEKYKLDDKIRKGKIHGYKEEFSEEQIKKLEELRKNR